MSRPPLKGQQGCGWFPKPIEKRDSIGPFATDAELFGPGCLDPDSAPVIEGTV